MSTDRRNNRIPIKNIYYMLAYAFKYVRYDRISKTIDTEKFENIYDLYIAILDIGISYLLKQGLYRNYEDKTDDIDTVRGRIDMVGTLRNKSNGKQLLTCEYDELAENNTYNQILKSTSMLLIKSNAVKADKSSLKKKMRYFSKVDQIDLKHVDFGRLTFDRNRKTYNFLINICEFVRDSLLLTEREGSKKTADINDQQMCTLYEKFILEYYKIEHPDLGAAAQKIEWNIDGTDIDGHKKHLPEMKTDITLAKDNSVLIIDAKYYSNVYRDHFGKDIFHSGNMYQIFTYVKNKQYQDKDKQVSGMLLYAKTMDEISPDETFSFHGNKISIKSLDLNRDFKFIKEQLDEIVKELTKR